MKQKINLYEGVSYLMNRELITPQVRKKLEYDSLYRFEITCIKYGMSICAFLFLSLRCNIINLLNPPDKDAY